MTTTKSKPPLRLLLAELRSQAERSGEDRSLQLSHGARVAWRVRGGVTTFAVSREKAPVGDRELITFKAQASVPVMAERIPAEGQTQRGEWYSVGWRWASK